MTHQKEKEKEIRDVARYSFNFGSQRSEGEC